MIRAFTCHIALFAFLLDEMSDVYKLIDSLLEGTITMEKTFMLESKVLI